MGLVCCAIVCVCVLAMEFQEIWCLVKIVFHSPIAQYGLRRWPITISPLLLCSCVYVCALCGAQEFPSSCEDFLDVLQRPFECKFFLESEAIFTHGCIGAASQHQYWNKVCDLLHAHASSQPLVLQNFAIIGRRVLQYHVNNSRISYMCSTRKI